MNLYDLIFYVFALIVIISGGVVVFSKNIMYAAFSLLFTFFGVAGLFILLNADFVGLAQIMVYVGGILILIIFGVMLTTRVTGVDIKSGVSGKFQMTLTAIISIFIAVFLIIMFLNGNWIIKDSPVNSTTINLIGNLLMTKYLLHFEISAILLLIAFIGAALIAKQKN